MSALDVLPTSAELAAPEQTLDSVDCKLRYLATAWKFERSKANKKTCLTKINYWLDVRIVLMKNASQT